MSKEQHISWQVSSKDLQVTPLGYSVELGDTSLVSPVSARHSTFERTGEFEVSLTGDGNFQEYPYNGITGATTSTIVRMRRNGETPTSVLIVGNDSFVYKMSLDCKQIMLYKQICETNVYSIDSVSCDSLGNIWVKDTSGTVTVLDLSFRVLNTFSLSPSSVFAATDPYRRVLWVLDDGKASIMHTSDMSLITEVDLSSTIIGVSSVYGWDFSGPSGTLFVIVPDGWACLAISMSGSVSVFSDGATGICQWGSKGALACVPSRGVVDVFDGTDVINSFSGSDIGLALPTRIASVGHGHAIVSDNYGTVSKIDEQFNVIWTKQAPAGWSNVDVRTTPGNIEKGRVSYILSTRGLLSVRDMGQEGWKYGEIDTPITVGRSPSPYPIATAVPELNAAHTMARIKAISSDDIEVIESSSSSSLSSLSSSSSSSTAMLTSSSSSSISSQSSPSSASSSSTSLSSISSESSPTSVSSESSVSSASSQSTDSSSSTSVSSVSSWSSDTSTSVSSTSSSMGFVSLVPNMTSNTYPTPYVATSYGTLTPAWRLFSNPPAGTTVMGVDSWDQIYLGETGKIANHYYIQTAGGDGCPLRGWTVSGSNNGSDWTTIHTVSGCLNWPVYGNYWDYIGNSTSYKYYRLTITEVASGLGVPILWSWRISE